MEFLRTHLHAFTCKWYSWRKRLFNLISSAKLFSLVSWCYEPKIDAELLSFDHLSKKGWWICFNLDIVVAVEASVYERNRLSSLTLLLLSMIEIERNKNSVKFEERFVSEFRQHAVHHREVESHSSCSNAGRLWPHSLRQLPQIASERSSTWSCGPP